MAVHEWFRRNQKRVYIIMIFAMAAWGIGSSAMFFIPQKAVGTIFGEKITGDELAEVEGRWRRIFFSGVQRPVLDLVWRQLVYLHEAKRLGIMVTDGDLLEGLQNLSFPLFGGKADLGAENLARFLCNTFNVNRNQLLQTIREAMLIEKLDFFIRDSVKITAEDAWQRYSAENENVKIKYAALYARDLVDAVDVTEEEIGAFYDRYKDVYPDKIRESYGYKEPEKIRVEYIMANYSELLKRVTVTDEGLQKYYQENKDAEFRQTVENEGMAEEAHGGDGLNSDSNSKKEDEGGTATAASDRKDGGEVKETDQEAQQDAVKEEGTVTVSNTDSHPQKPIRYKPYDEVKESIKEKLQKEAAGDMANELIGKVDEEIYEGLDNLERPSFSKLAEKHGLIYNILRPKAGATEFFSKEEAGALLIGTDRLADMAFERELYEPSPPQDALEGKYVFQVIDSRSPATPPLADIYERVKHDLKLEKAVRKARELSEQCLARMKETTFKEGFDLFTAEMKGITVDSSETEYFSRPVALNDRPSGYIVAMNAYRPNVASKAFSLKKDEVAIAVEEEGKKGCYVIMLLDRMEADRKKFDENKAQIMNRYLAEKQGYIISKWEEDLMKQTRLDIKL